jgi:hypothetical protein
MARLFQRRRPTDNLGSVLNHPSAFSFTNWSALTPLDYFFEALAIVAVVVEAWALVDALVRPSRAYPAAGKLTKPLWLIILGVSTVVGLAYAALAGAATLISMLPIAAFIAAAVYLTDVRPKVKQIGSGGSSHSGPYGPW